MSERIVGTVKWVNLTKGYGFITRMLEQPQGEQNFELLLSDNDLSKSTQLKAANEYLKFLGELQDIISDLKGEKRQRTKIKEITFGESIQKKNNQEGSQDIFVHFSAIRGEGFKNLQEGQKVEFTIEKGPKGLEAADIVIL